MLLLLASCAYEPPLAETEDYPYATTLSGDIVQAGGVPDSETRIGHVLLYDINDLPPPAGFGLPVDLSTVPSDAWGYASNVLDTGGETLGVASAPWAMAGIPDGTWLVTALVDNDGDFSPFPGISDFAGGATCGDQTGAYVTDALTQTPLPITTTAPDHISGLNLVVGPPIPFERPAFELWTAGDGPDYAPAEQSTLITIDPTLSPLAVPQVINLVSHPVAHPMLILNPTASAHCPTTFTVIRRDADGDGNVDPHPSALGSIGYEDVYPIVIMALVADADGNPPTGNTIISPLPVRPTYDTSQALETPFQETLLQLLFTGTFIELVDGEQVEYQGAPPEGTWGVAVLNENGQMWQVPNGLADPDTWPQFADDIDATQSGVVVTAIP